jgi:hypothetical protein
MKETIVSEVTGIEYKPKDVVRILNIYQATYYISRGVFPVDLYSSADYRTGDPRLVFLFNRKDSRDVYDAWCRRNGKTKPTEVNGVCNE